MINTELFKEVSPLSAKDCFILIERQKSNFNFPIHIHPEYELNYIENAKGAQQMYARPVTLHIIKLLYINAMRRFMFTCAGTPLALPY